jgi:hypothetical protein
VTAVMLTPGEMSVEQTRIHRRHFGGDGSDEAALLVQPFRIALLRDPVT